MLVASKAPTLTKEQIEASKSVRSYTAYTFREGKARLNAVDQF